MYESNWPINSTVISANVHTHPALTKTLTCLDLILKYLAVYIYIYIRVKKSFLKFSDLSHPMHTLTTLITCNILLKVLILIPHKFLPNREL